MSLKNRLKKAIEAFRAPECDRCPTKFYLEELIEYKSCVNCGKFATCEHRPECREKIRVNCLGWGPEREDKK